MESVTFTGVLGLVVSLFLIVLVVAASVELIELFKKWAYRRFGKNRGLHIIKVERGDAQATALFDAKGHLLSVHWHFDE